ncbi:MAG: ATP-binding protein, partial [Planctomycetes bacterium]|nr:ATP-binding protein [Planctomycetota bacterium]
LTEMEKYDGVVILATNRAESLDSAFERRLGYRIRFERPSASAREAIWRGLVTDTTPLASDVDFQVLARRFDFSGGAIKNVLLRAAFDASTNGGVISMKNLEEAAKEERPLVETKRMGFAAAAARD